MSIVMLAMAVPGRGVASTRPMGRTVQLSTIENYGPTGNHGFPESCTYQRNSQNEGLHKLVDRVAAVCENFDGGFFAFEKALRPLVWEMARAFIALFLLARRLGLEKQQRQYPGYRRLHQDPSRTLRTMFGEVCY